MRNVFQNMKKKIFLILVVLLGFGLRVYGLNWDQGHHLHPDERMIVMVVNKIHMPDFSDWKSIFTRESPLNPKFFPYGSFPIYLLKLVSGLAALLMGKQWASYQYLPTVGRIISIFFDLGTIVLIFKIGKRVFGQKAGQWASLIYATCVFPIQSSHFYTVDVILNFFVWLTIWQLLQFYQLPSLRKAIGVGASFGLALATKVSAMVLLVSVGTALFVNLLLLGFKFWRGQREKWWRKILLLVNRRRRQKLQLGVIRRLFLWGGIRGGIICLFFSLLTFVLCEPYALIDFSTFWRQIGEQQRMVKNAYVFPYTLQYVGTASYIYFLKNMVVWGMGLGFGLVSIGGAIWYLIDLAKRLLKKGDYDKEALELIVVSFGLSYFLTVGNFAVKFMRYFLPLYPFFIFAGVKFLMVVGGYLKKNLRVVMWSVLLLGHFIWVLFFCSIYSKPHSRVQASEWINENIPLRSVLAVEHWDDRLPFWGGEKYRFVEMKMYDSDKSASKWQMVEENLEKADYLILASNRLYLPLQELDNCELHKICYPKTGQYYRDLFSGKLGFQKVIEFSSYPGLKLGDWKLEFADDQADESFTVYDHPKVIIFKKF